MCHVPALCKLASTSALLNGCVYTLVVFYQSTMMMAHKLTILVASLSFIRDGGLAAILLESEPTSTAGIQGAADTSITADDGAVTPPPEMIELHRRQESTIKYLLAPDATCGFDSKACQSNPSIMRCTSSSFPYCHTMYFITSTIIGFQCRASAYGGTPELLRTTSSGGPARTYASRTATRSSSTQIRTTTTRGSVIVVTTTLSAEPVTSSSSDINDYIDSRINESRSDNTGAIVGGSIGGAAVLAISALAGVLFFRRRKKKNTDEVRSSQAVETMEASGANGPLAYYPASPSYPGSSYPVSPGGPVGTISTASTPHSPGLEDSHKTSLLTRGHNQNHRLSEVDGGAGSQVHELAAR
ncbi:hypothetical protein MGG_06986 [Pyricularia oryzae 70-15]|uniref:Mid2 domain-containing protein n=3 Tax=Pyricularia oryzae TaxID=318829 RepID=G4MNW8_PYRO7|nr:uncharacterized protein MGG_06986 [Pyricularia oryzae 70-15]EHA57125.1 hypothetical protein MGG_06986 [Pyricularia oryzae 70-15]ELQ36415.1 hypothetical protein OOU_Y34scaffold00663g15 [Pyricularia oryzae Y34]